MPLVREKVIDILPLLIYNIINMCGKETAI